MTPDPTGYRWVTIKVKKYADNIQMIISILYITRQMLEFERTDVYTSISYGIEMKWSVVYKTEMII